MSHNPWENTHQDPPEREVDPPDKEIEELDWDSIEKSRELIIETIIPEDEEEPAKDAAAEDPDSSSESPAEA